MPWLQVSFSLFFHFPSTVNIYQHTDEWIFSPVITNFSSFHALFNLKNVDFKVLSKTSKIFKVYHFRVPREEVFNSND